MATKQSVLLCILDGWGISPFPSLNKTGNSIDLAHTPNYTELLGQFPNTQLQSSEEWVGLPAGQMGNSEVGHMAIGCGRVFLQDLVKISKALNGDFLKNNGDVQDFVSTLRQSKKACHLWGLFSPGGVHSHQNHILAVAKYLEEQGIHTWCHLVTDGRDTPPQSALNDIKEFDAFLKSSKFCKLATLMGRYYAMDRDKRWERSEKAYLAVVKAKAPTFESLQSAIDSHYQENITDEFFSPLVHVEYKGVSEKDALWMMNFRSDRVRQIATALVDPKFKEFETFPPKWSKVLGLSDYSLELNPFFTTLFPKELIKNSLGEVISTHHLKQFRIAETEKYAHVTFFFNGGKESPFPGEDRCLIPSSKVATYDLKPEMSAKEITEKALSVLKSKEYDLIVINYANPDMVGHTGNLEATIQAISFIDICLGRLSQASKEYGYAFIITADHGNAEQMIDEVENLPQTAHTCFPVPFILAHSSYKRFKHHQKKTDLTDIAPTVLKLLGIQKPLEMSGLSLI